MLKKLEKIIFSIFIVLCVTFIFAIAWEHNISDKVLDEVLISLSQGKYPDNLIIKQAQQLSVDKISRNYEILFKDNDIIWGQIYRVKFTSGVSFVFLVDVGIISDHQISFLGNDANKK